jgi:hypothetical protein
MLGAADGRTRAMENTTVMESAFLALIVLGATTLITGLLMLAM